MSSSLPKKILILSLTLNIFFLIMASYFIIQKNGINFLLKKIGIKNEIVLQEIVFNGRYKNIKSMYDILPADSSEIIFLGNSITQYCQWGELFNNTKVKNRGIGGDVTWGILNRLKNIIENHPKKIFFMAGINDLGRGISVSEIMQNYSNIVGEIQSHSPGTLIYLQSVLPVNYKLYSNRIKTESIVELNKLIENYAKQKKITYIDLFSNFAAENNQLNERFTFDGIHLNGDGYLLWKSLIKDFVN